jgi:hypothetical protein
MRRSTGKLTLAMVGAALLLLLAAATALADGSGGPKPTVESESASSVTKTDATLEAQINPGSGEDGFSLATTYEFFLESPWCGSFHPFGGCEASGGKLVYKGVLPAGSKPQLVSVDLASVAQVLSPSTTYGYRVLATNEVGEAFGGERTFMTPPVGKAPVIESVSISHLTPTAATLEAKINSGDLKTEYAFQLWSSPCSKKGAGCELIVDVPLPTGASLYGSSEPQTVSLDLNSAGVTLDEGEYGFSVVADNEDGPASAFGGVFEAPPGVIDPPLGASNPPGPTALPGPTGPTPSTSNGASQPAESGTTSSTTLGTSSPLGAFAAKTGAGSGKPKAKHGNHHKRKHHGKNAAKRLAHSKQQKR